VTQVQSLHCCGSINASFVVASKGVIDQFGTYYPLSYMVVLKIVISLNFSDWEDLLVF